MKRLFALMILVSCLALSAGDKRAMTFEDMFTMKRITHISVSPDGAHVLYRVRQAELESNNYKSWIYMVDVASGESRLMTPEDQNCSSPVWQPDGKAFAYAHAGQIFIKALDGSAPRQVTDAPEGAGGPHFSKDGASLLYASTIKRAGQEEPQDHSGRLIDDLMFRQWNEWRNDVRNHVFMVPSDGEKARGRDLTPGDFDAPPLDLGSSHDYTFSPDGREVAYVKNTEKMVAATTNNDIFIVDLKSGEERRITESRGCDAEPHYSPDGRYIAYWNMARPNFEADQHVIWLHDRKTGKNKALSANTNHSAGNLVWSPDSRTIYYLAQNKGARSIFSIDLNGNGKQLTEAYSDSNLAIDAAGSHLFFTREATHMPKEIFSLNLSDGKVRQLTGVNKEVLAELDMQPWEDFWFESGGDQVQGFLVKPPNFDETRKYPMVFLIHGGPQGMWANNFHYRWNSQMFAAPGYVVVLVNPHGSKGYGQKFCDAVTKDWGGLPYQDLMKGLDTALDRYSFIDKERLGTAGASYGGYMINWIATRENNPFKAMVSHNGVFNLPSMAFATEELWFTEWEFGGTYYDNPELYEKWSPHRYVKNLKSPMLVIHSEKDYRVPLNQGMELFTAHQRQGIPSQWLYFPDEDHFVTKPKNARMWWKTVHGWLGRYLKPNKQQGS